jgi:hypothetical protein|tara:strand:- start:527 stop:1078 length:552 start_codon:yes stop_codon:yes gene_type:complete
MNRKQSRINRNRQHERFDTDYLSVSALLKSVKAPTKVVNKRQVIVNKAFAMTHKTLTNGKEFRQLLSVIRQVSTLNDNIPFVKEAQPYMLVVAPKGFLSHMNKLIDSCNYYIDNCPSKEFLKLGNIQKMDYIDSFDMTGVLFYDKKGNHTNYTKEEDMMEYITPQVKEQPVRKVIVHQLEDIL